MANLRPVDRMYLERLFEMGGGYVLSFSNTTFADFVRGSTGEDIYAASYSGNGDSKANRLRAFWNTAPDDKVATLLGDLLTLMIDNEKITSDGPEADRVKAIIAKLGGQMSVTPRPPTKGPSHREERRAFVSYAVEKKEAGGAVKVCLSQFGYECFLAHEDLHVSEEWKHRILEELGTADVFVALLSREFMASKWCGQELGFIVSRPDVLVVPLSLDGTVPYGFIEHLQGIRVNRKNLHSVLEEVLYRKRPRQMIPAQIEHIRSASSFRSGEAAVLPLVSHFARFTDEEVDDFTFAGGKGVIHIGFLSSTKIFSLNRNLYAYAESALRSGSVGRCLAARQFSHEPLRTSSSALHLRVLSSIRRVRPTLRRLFRAVIHPDLGRAVLWSFDSTARPHPDSVGTRTTSVPYPVQSMSLPKDGRTDPTSCLNRRDAHPCVTQGTGERESLDLQSRFVYVPKRCGGRPISP